MLHSPEYRRRYADFLKSDFPRVPLPGNRAVFSALIFPGARLVSLHLMETEDRGDGAAFHRTGSNQVDKVRYAPPSSGLPGRVWINREQYFESVEPEIWASTIGGYRPAEKWLKDRKGRTLSEDDIDHYRKIVAALTETRRLMAEIDEVIEKHGGWPGGVPDRRGTEPGDDEYWEAQRVWLYLRASGVLLNRPGEAAELLDFTRTAAVAVLQALEDSGFLALTPDGRFGRSPGRL